MKITLFKGVYTKEIFKHIDVSEFFHDVKNTYKELKDTKEKRLQACFAGLFSDRNTLVEHSGLMMIDIDYCKPFTQEARNEILLNLQKDKYTFAVWKSHSGRGYKVLVKIPEKEDNHPYYYDAISSYYYDEYNIITDPAVKHKKALCAVSYDPDLFFNFESIKWRKALKPKRLKSVKGYVSDEDINAILEQIEEQSIDITQDDYIRYRNISFALAEQFGDAGREVFHNSVKFGTKYNEQTADSQYDYALKFASMDKPNKVEIGTYFFYCKEHHIKVRTKKGAEDAAKIAVASQSEMAEEELAKILTPAQIAQMKQGDGEKIEFPDDVDITVLIVNYLNMKKRIYYDAINEYLYFIDSDEQVSNKDINTFYIDTRRVIGETSKAIFDVCIFSDYIPSVNNALDFFSENKVSRTETPYLDKFLSCLKYKRDSEYDRKLQNTLIQCWLMNVVQAIQNDRTGRLMLVFQSDKQNIGKTLVFRNLLPKKLRKYYIESNLQDGKDDSARLCSSLLYCIDEMEIDEKKTSYKRLKEIISKENFTYRKPYDRIDTIRRKLAVLCGTSNEDDFLSDPTGNTRIIPIALEGIDVETYLQIDKDKLWQDIFYLYRKTKYTEPPKEAMEYLKSISEHFYIPTEEDELILRIFEVPEDDTYGEELTATDIKIDIEMAYRTVKISINKIGKAMKKLGIPQHTVTKSGRSKRVYRLVRKQMLKKAQNG